MARRGRARPGHAHADFRAVRQIGLQPAIAGRSCPVRQRHIPRSHDVAACAASRRSLTPTSPSPSRPVASKVANGVVPCPKPAGPGLQGLPRRRARPVRTRTPGRQARSIRPACPRPHGVRRSRAASPAMPPGCSLSPPGRRSRPRGPSHERQARRPPERARSTPHAARRRAALSRRRAFASPVISPPRTMACSRSTCSVPASRLTSADAWSATGQDRPARCLRRSARRPATRESLQWQRIVRVRVEGRQRQRLGRQLAHQTRRVIHARERERPARMQPSGRQIEAVRRHATGLPGHLRHQRERAVPQPFSGICPLRAPARAPPPGGIGCAGMTQGERAVPTSTRPIQVGSLRALRPERSTPIRIPSASGPPFAVASQREGPPPQIETRPPDPVPAGRASSLAPAARYRQALAAVHGAREPGMDAVQSGGQSFEIESPVLERRRERGIAGFVPPPRTCRHGGSRQHSPSQPLEDACRVGRGSAGRDPGPGDRPEVRVQSGVVPVRMAIDPPTAAPSSDPVSLRRRPVRPAAIRADRRRHEEAGREGRGAGPLRRLQPLQRVRRSGASRSPLREIAGGAIRPRARRSHRRAKSPMHWRRRPAPTQGRARPGLTQQAAGQRRRLGGQIKADRHPAPRPWTSLDPRHRGPAGSRSGPFRAAPPG